MLKKIWSLPVLIAVILTGLIYTIFFGVTPVTNANNPEMVSRIVKRPKSDSAFGQIFHRPGVNDSLPHYEYHRITDSLKRETDKREWPNKSITTGGYTIGQIGIAKVNDKQHFSAGESDQKDVRYYLTLEGYQLEPYARFFVQNGTYNLAYATWDSTKKTGNHTVTYGHYERKQIPVRYSDASKKLLIPISEKTFRIGVIVVRVMMVITLFVFIYVFVGLPIKILIRIAKGDAFSVANIRRFKIIGYGIITVWGLKIALPYILRGIFSGLIPSELVLQPFLWTITKGPDLLFLGIASLIISAAFRKGYNLQQEQALTI